MNFEYEANPFTGRSGYDFVVGLLNGPDHVFSGGGGNDVLIGDFGNFFFEPSRNSSFENAAVRDNAGTWSVGPNPTIANSQTIPHATIYVTGDRETQEFFSFTVGAGETLLAGTDFSTYDTVLTLFDSSGAMLLVNDNDAGDWGSE